MSTVFDRFKKKDTIPKHYLFSSAALSSLIIPLIIEQVLSLMVGTADSMMVSGAGEAALSAVSLIDQINAIIINLFIAFSTGGAVVASQYIGGKKNEEANRSASQLLLLLTVSSLILTALILVFKRQLISLVFGAIEADVMEHALTYLTITAISFPFLALLSGGSALFRSMSRSATVTKNSLIINVINVVGNAILIYGFDMGVAGAAYATLFSRIVGCISLLYLLSRSNGVIHLDIADKKKWKPDMHLLGRIMKIGVPSGLENSFFQIGRTLVMGVVTLFGTSQIAANAVSNTITGIVWMPPSAINLAIVTVVGQCVGARDREQVTFYMNKLLKMSGFLFLGTASFMMLLLPLILMIYNLTPDTQRTVYILLSFYSVLGVLCYSPSFSIPNVLRAAGDVTYSMTVSILSMIIFRVGGSYLLGLYFGLGVVGVWISMTIDWIVRSCFFLPRLLRGRWLDNALCKELN